MSIREIQAGRPGFVPSLARAGLHVLSWGWAAGAWFKDALRGAGFSKTRRLDVPVVCVGNIAAGGTGKTPFVIWLARRLQAEGRTPGVLARGYGGASAADPELNDEGAVIRAALPDVPQVQHSDRYAAGVRLLRAHPSVDVVLLDDGFQHRQLHRNLDIVLLDGLRPFGHGYRLPRGLLRERPEALSRAGCVVVTRAERLVAEVLESLKARIRGLTKAPLVVARTRSEGGDALQGARVLACCGIGNPDAFLGTLADLGATVVAKRLLGDHERLPAGGWAALVGEAAAAGARVVTTRKDAVKVAALPPEVTVVDIEVEVIEGEDELWAAVESAIG